MCPPIAMGRTPPWAKTVAQTIRHEFSSLWINLEE
jgi:hypothetical protein